MARHGSASPPHVGKLSIGGRVQSLAVPRGCQPTAADNNTARAQILPPFRL